MKPSRAILLAWYFALQTLMGPQSPPSRVTQPVILGPFVSEADCEKTRAHIEKWWRRSDSTFPQQFTTPCWETK